MNFNVGMIGTIVVLLIILGFLYFRKRSDEKGKEEIKKFLESLQNDFETVIMEYIEKLDFSNFDNIALMEQDIINSLVDILWNKAVEELENYVTDPMNKALIKKFLNREYIEEFTRKIFEQAKVQVKYTARYNDAIVEANKEAILLEAGITKQNEEIVNNTPVDFREVEDIEPGTIINGEGEQVEREVIPQHDEEPEEVDLKEDNSIELIDR